MTLDLNLHRKTKKIKLKFMSEICRFEAEAVSSSPGFFRTVISGVTRAMQADTFEREYSECRMECRFPAMKA